MEMGVVARDVQRAVARDRRRGVDVAGEREQPQQRAVGRDRVEVLVLGTDQDLNELATDVCSIRRGCGGVGQNPNG